MKGASGTPIADRAIGLFLDEGRTLISFDDALSFIEKNEENATRRPVILFVKWSAINHMTLINIGRSLALW